MKTWAVDVELRVRKTLLVNGNDEDEARQIAGMLMRSAWSAMSTFVKWTDNRRAHRPSPVETIIDNDPQIIAVRDASAPPESAA